MIIKQRKILWRMIFAREERIFHLFQRLLQVRMFGLSDWWFTLQWSWWNLRIQCCVLQKSGGCRFWWWVSWWGSCDCKRISHRWTWQVVKGSVAGNTGKSRKASITSSWTFIWSFIVSARGKAPLHNQGIIWNDQVRGWLHIWISGPKVHTDITNQDFRKLLRAFNSFPCLSYRKK